MLWIKYQRAKTCNIKLHSLDSAKTIEKQQYRAKVYQRKDFIQTQQAMKYMQTLITFQFYTFM